MSSKPFATRVLAATLIAATTASAARADSPATSPSTAPSTRAAIDDALRRLAGPDLLERDAAQAELLAAGATADSLDALAAAATDPDVVARIDALRVQLRERDLLSPSKITIDGEKLDFAFVLAELGRQARTEFTTDGMPTNPQQFPPIELHLRDASLWEAVREISRVAPVGFYPDGGQNGRWRVIPGGQNMMSFRGDEQGGFLVQPTSLNYSRSVSLDNNGGGGNGRATNTSFSIQLRLLAEPKFRLDGQTMLVLRRAVDSAGNDLIMGGQNRTSGGASRSQANFGMQLSYPATPGQTIRELSGTMHVAVTDRVEPIRSDNLLRDGPIVREIDGARITIEPAATPNGVELNITIDRPRGDANNGGRGDRSNQWTQAIPQARVAGPNGQPLSFSGYNSSGDANGRLIVRATFSRNGGFRPNGTQTKADDPLSLSLDLPVSSRLIEVPFELHDLPMP